MTPLDPLRRTWPPDADDGAQALTVMLRNRSAGTLFGLRVARAAQYTVIGPMGLQVSASAQYAVVGPPGILVSACVVYAVVESVQSIQQPAALRRMLLRDDPLDMSPVRRRLATPPIGGANVHVLFMGA